MNHSFEKAARFSWRAARNLLCIIPWGKSFLFPSQVLAHHFGRGDADYAISVFLHHHRQLNAAGFPGADRILEVGPGRNVGTSLLMWALNHSRSGRASTVLLWDVIPNMVVNADALVEAARALLVSPGLQELSEAVQTDRIVETLSMVARSELRPDIQYRVQPLSELIAAGEANDVALVYSQAAIEHIWHVADFWRAIIGFTRPGGWHSHRIDLADHGRRETNYIEMLEWSPIGYWLTMRFIPGAINRWRASMHLDFLIQNGLNILSARRETSDTLPTPRSRIDRTFLSLDDLDLRTTAIDVVAVKLTSTKIISSVLMFCPQFRPLVGGAEVQAEKLAAALAEIGCRVTIVTPRIDPKSPESEEVNGVRIERFPLTDLARRYPVRGVAVLNIPYILWHVARAVRLRLKGADVLHCHIASLQTAGAALAGRMAGIPVLCKAAIADHRSDLGEIEKAGPSGRLVAWLVRALIQTWVATTAAVEVALIRAGVEPRRIARIPNGVDLPEDPDTREPVASVRRFLYLGRLSTNIQRDVPTLVNAFDRLARTYPDLELAIVGGGDLLDETRRLAGTCVARDRIHLPGFDNPEKWLAWADCFVLPSRREGLSNALLEAMAAGLPCIANDIPPNREVLGDGEAGILVPVEDLDALEKAMRAVAQESGVAEYYARKAKERAAQCYSIGSVADRYLALYRDLRMESSAK